MKSLETPRIFLWSVLLFLQTSPFVWASDEDEILDATAEASTTDPYLALQESFEEAAEQFDKAIEEGGLDRAMDLIVENENTFAGQWDVGRFGFAARMALGDEYRRKGDLDLAIELYKSARPGGGCGNCMAGQAIERADAIARIREKRLNFPAAFFTYLSALPDIPLGGGAPIVFFGLFRSGAACLAPFFACWLLWRVIRSLRSRLSTDSPAA